MRRFLSISCAAALVVAFSLPAVGPAGHVSAASPPLQKILVRGAAIQGANGLAVDHAGRLLVASVWGQQITAVDRSTGRILQRYGPVVDGIQLGTPDDVAVGPDGSIYYTDIMGGNVGRISADGHLTKQPVATFNNPIAFDAKGRLFVAQAFQGDCLYEVDPALVKPPTKILCGSGEKGFPDQLNGFDFGLDGMLYAPRPALRQIVRIDIATRTVTVVAKDLGGNPSSVEFDANGHLYASLGQGPVIRVDIETGAVTNVTTLPFGLDNMVFDNRGRLFVSNSDDGHVDRVLPATGSHRQLLKGGLIIPGGVAVLPQATGGDRVVVADLWRVATYNGLTGRLLDLDADFGAFGAVPGVTTTAADGEHVILSSWIAEAVTVWDPAANERVAVYGGFGLPLNAIRFGKDLVVAALGPAPVVRQAPGGAQTQARHRGRGGPDRPRRHGRRPLGRGLGDRDRVAAREGRRDARPPSGRHDRPRAARRTRRRPRRFAARRRGRCRTPDADRPRDGREVDRGIGPRPWDGRASGCAAHLDVQRRRRWAEGRHLRDGRHRRRHLPVLTRALNHAHTQCPDGAADPAAPSPISRTQVGRCQPSVSPRRPRPPRPPGAGTAASGRRSRGRPPARHPTRAAPGHRGRRCRPARTPSRSRAGPGCGAPSRA